MPKNKEKSKKSKWPQQVLPSIPPEEFKAQCSKLNLFLIRNFDIHVRMFHDPFLSEANINYRTFEREKGVKHTTLTIINTLTNDKEIHTIRPTSYEAEFCPLRDAIQSFKEFHRCYGIKDECEDDCEDECEDEHEV